MSFSRNYRRRNGGLVLDQSLSAPRFSRSLRDGPDVSWLHRCRVGDDQGAEGACAIFAFASWAEIVHGYDISDADTLQVYRDTLSELGRPVGSGLSFAEAFVAAHKAGWLPGARGLAQAHDLSALPEQPILAGYRVTPAFDNVNAAGCLDHAADNSIVRGYHAEVVVGHGRLQRFPSLTLVYKENSWGLPWAWNGIGILTEDLHRELVRELWLVR